MGILIIFRFVTVKTRYTSGCLVACPCNYCSLLVCLTKYYAVFSIIELCLTFFSFVEYKLLMQTVYSHVTWSLSINDLQNISIHMYMYMHTGVKVPGEIGGLRSMFFLCML